MKKLTYILILLLTITSCKDKKAESQSSKDNEFETPEENIKPNYPDDLLKIFDAHGGLAIWNDMRTLEFSIEKPDGYEITTTDLQDRYALVELPKHIIGFDGESVWMKSDKGAQYDGEPTIYYNYMFYLYAMPFVLADEGIKYSEAEPLTFEGKTYPGIRISYLEDTVEKSNNQYVLYYDADSYKMTWLATNTTLDKKEVNKEWDFIKYSEWQEVEGLLLPKTLAWYDVKNNMPTTVKNEVTFSNISLSTDKMNLKMYMMPEGAEEVQ